MGASGWTYYAPYDADFGATLARLHEEVFASGKFYRRSKLRKPKSIEALRKQNAEDGTHSILDITHVGPKPTKPGREDFLSFRGTFASVRELHDDDLVTLFGTTRPTRAAVEGRALDIMQMRSRGVGTIVVIYDGEEPRELLFTGFSGD